MRMLKGDSERQATLRDGMIKKGDETERSKYLLKILSVLKPGMRLLDIGCGTAHILQELHVARQRASFVGLDISPAMLKIAKENSMGLSSLSLVEGDGLRLPFSDCDFDIVATRLAEYSPKEAYRVLREGGYFFEYGLGPEADKEIVEFFPMRIEKENFFFPKNLNRWKEEVREDIENSGFVVSAMEEYKEEDYYQKRESVMDLIEMVPLVKDFERKKDKRTIERLAEKYGEQKGIRITWHYYVLEARRPQRRE